MAFVQLVRPGAPVVFGSFASSMSMQTGAPTFGTPEPSLVLYVVAQLARRLGVPFRSGGSLVRVEAARRAGGVRVGQHAAGDRARRRQLRAARRGLARGRPRDRLREVRPRRRPARDDGHVRARRRPLARTARRSTRSARTGPGSTSSAPRTRSPTSRTPSTARPRPTTPATSSGSKTAGSTPRSGPTRSGSSTLAEYEPPPIDDAVDEELRDVRRPGARPRCPTRSAEPMAGGAVQSIDRAFAVLRQVATEPGGISDVARRVDLPGRAPSPGCSARSNRSARSCGSATPAPTASAPASASSPTRSTPSATLVAAGPAGARRARRRGPARRRACRCSTATRSCTSTTSRPRTRSRSATGPAPACRCTSCRPGSCCSPRRPPEAIDAVPRRDRWRGLTARTVTAARARSGAGSTSIRRDGLRVDDRRVRRRHHVGRRAGRRRAAARRSPRSTATARATASPARGDADADHRARHRRGAQARRSRWPVAKVRAPRHQSRGAPA